MYFSHLKKDILQKHSQQGLFIYESRQPSYPFFDFPCLKMWSWLHNFSTATEKCQKLEIKDRHQHPYSLYEGWRQHDHFHPIRDKVLNSIFNLLILFMAATFEKLSWRLLWHSNMLHNTEEPSIPLLLIQVQFPSFQHIERAFQGLIYMAHTLSSSTHQVLSS